MLTPRGNIHNNRLPSLGAIGYICDLPTVDPRRKCIVSHYPLCDNVLPWSIGIHTVFVRFLDNGEARQFAGNYFREADYAGYVERSEKEQMLIWMLRYRNAPAPGMG